MAAQSPSKGQTRLSLISNKSYDPEPTLSTGEPSPSGDSPPREELSLWERIAYWAAIGGGAGLSPWAPGTCGAAVGLLVVLALAASGSFWGYLVGTCVLIALGVPICTVGERVLAVKDPHPVVWDELATVPLIFAFVPPESLMSPALLLVGFALHRVFDILKPPPLRSAEWLPGGWGIMADDVGAGLYGCGALHLLLALGGGPWLGV